MKRTGIIRRLDKQGRVFIPQEIRETLDLKKEFTYLVYEKDGAIYVKQQGCVFCGNLNAEREYRGRLVCDNCIENLKWKK